MRPITYYRSSWLEIIHLQNRPITFAPHIHVSSCIIGLIAGGAARLTRGEKSEDCLPGSFFVIFPYQLHALNLRDGCDLVAICLHTDFLKDQTPAKLLNEIQQLSFCLPPTVHCMPPVTALDTLYEYTGPQPADRSIYQKASSLHSAPEYINSVTQMAQEARYTSSYYINKIRRHIGISPHRFQLHSKIRKAQAMIENGESLAKVATDLGFYDQSHFTRYFKKTVGLTPTEYKQSIRLL